MYQTCQSYSEAGVDRYVFALKAPAHVQ